SQKHPHGRGEDVSDTDFQGLDVETPPRTWGRQDQGVFLSSYDRNTPTDVGKTPAGSRWKSAAWKHPHGRGEDSARAAAGALAEETPPRTWGRPPLNADCMSNIRNTPTDVGKTPRRLLFRGCPRKHPHGRGEDPLVL